MYELTPFEFAYYGVCRERGGPWGSTHCLDGTTLS